MAQWVIQSQEKFKAEWIDKLGREEFARRDAISKAKADELDDGTNAGWQESCVLSAIFLSIALELSEENFDKLRALPVSKWRTLAYRLCR